jgi:uncharacterized protein (DUF4213/DUF364 family)
MGPAGPEETTLLNAMLDAVTRPDVAIEEIVVGSKFVAVRAGGRMGLSSLLGARADAGDQELVQKLIGRPVSEAAACMLEASPCRTCIGLAAYNAANSPDPQKPMPAVPSAEALITDLGRNGRVGLVGHFPFTPELRRKVQQLHLFELKDVPDAVPREQWDHILGQIDVLALTATALLTRQMAYYLGHARQATIVVLGPTTPLSRPLFDRGADYLCGSVVTDQPRVAEGIREGLAFRAIKKRGGLSFAQWQKTDIHG